MEAMILSEIRDIRKTQNEQGREIGQINTRVAVIETSMEQINSKLGETKQTANGTADYADDIDGRVEVLEGWCQAWRGRMGRMGWALVAAVLSNMGVIITAILLGRKK